jgi:hypothetical protein
MIVAGYPPEGGGGGGVIMRSLLKEYPRDRLTWLALRPDRTKPIKWYEPKVTRAVFPLYLPAKFTGLAGLWLTRGVLSLLDSLAVVYASLVIRRHRPDDILIVADSYTILPAWRILKRNPASRFHLSVHDDPMIGARLVNSSIDSRALSTAFASLCQRAASVDCISARMALRYENIFGIHPMVLTRCVEDSRLAEIAQRPIQQNGTGLNMILSGWGDCPPPWPANLIEALKVVRTELKINFHVFDPRFRPYQKHEWVILHEHVPEAEFDALLGQMDFSYAPDPLTLEGRQFAATSLSTKIVTSICAGLPFIYHGPHDSTVGDLLQLEPRLGVIVESNCSREIAAGIKALHANYKDRVLACVAFAQTHYSARIMRQKFASRFER